MANKREFKKYVEAVGASAYEAMMSTYYNVDGAKKEDILKAVEKLAATVATARSNANVFFDKGHKAFDSVEAYSKAKADFFKKLFDKINGDFVKGLDDSLKTFNAAIPAKAKELNKEAASK